MNKIKNAKNFKISTGNEQTKQTIVYLEENNKQLSDQLCIFKETLDKKEKEFSQISKQKDNFRKQLESAVRCINSKEANESPTKSNIAETLPSLQSQLQILQDESKNSETTRDVTDQLLDDFERNDRLMREKFESMARKLKNYKEKIRAKNELIKELKSSVGATVDNSDDRVKKTRDLQENFDKQIKVIMAKSEEQADQLIKRSKELEDALEKIEDEKTDLLIKYQESEHEIEKFKHEIQKLKNDDGDIGIIDLPNPPKNKGYEVQMELLGKVEKLDGKIMELTESISKFNTEHSARIEKELQEINSYFTSSSIIDLGETTFAKLKKMKEANTVVQIVRKVQTEGYTWLLVEKKDPLNNPLRVKTSSNSLSKSSMEIQPSGRKIFWVCEEALKEDMIEYLYTFTP